MNEKTLNNWLKTLGEAWVTRNPEMIGSICAEDVKYYEHTFEEPRLGRDAVVAEWQSVPNSQKDITFDYDVIGIASDIGIAHWRASFTRMPSEKKDTLDGIFTVKLDENGLCTEFHMWWVTKS